jgi:hypothetical protein
VSQFCRHNRFVAECPICSKGTVLDPSRRGGRRASSGGGRSRGARSATAGAPVVKGPYGLAGPYAGDDGQYEVRLERVPGGLRLAAWAAGAIQRAAPVLAAADLAGLLRSASESGALEERDALDIDRELDAGAVGRSPGRAGELRDELRVEPLEQGRLRIARWVMRPGHGWQLQEAPVLLPAARFAQALAGAARPPS